MQIIDRPLTAVADGLMLPECPRWHDGRLYYSDIQQGRVYRLEGNDSNVLYRTDGDFTGGIGFAADGCPIVVHSKQRRLVRIGVEGAVAYADLSEHCRFVLNDMAIANGFAYVSQPGFDIWSGHTAGYPPPTELLMVDPDGCCTVAATNMMSPNGVAISADGRTLYVAESMGFCVTAFTIDTASGALSERRVFARLPDGAIPDGICLDRDGAVWAAAPVRVSDSGVGPGPGVIRLTADGSATHVVRVGDGRRALACVLGGVERSDLYICTVDDFDGAAAFTAATGRIERISVGFHGAGIP